MHDKRKLIGVFHVGTKAVQFAVSWNFEFISTEFTCCFILKIFKSDPHFKELCSHEIKVTQICPRDVCVEQDPSEILESALECARKAIEQLPQPFTPQDIVAIGVTNQRETVVVWDKATGKPLHNAIGKWSLSFSPSFELNLVNISVNSVE